MDMIKPFKAWIIVDEKGEPALWDCRPQIFWLREIARNHLREFGGHGNKVIRCDISA